VLVLVACTARALENAWLFVSDPSSSWLSSGSFTESELGEIRFPEISAPILEKVCQYFYYKLRFTNSTHDIPPFDITPEYSLELLMASNYLDT